MVVILQFSLPAMISSLPWLIQFWRSHFGAFTLGWWIFLLLTALHPWLWLLRIARPLPCTKLQSAPQMTDANTRETLSSWPMQLPSEEDHISGDDVNNIGEGENEVPSVCGHHPRCGAKWPKHNPPEFPEEDDVTQVLGCLNVERIDNIVPGSGNRACVHPAQYTSLYVAIFEAGLTLPVPQVFQQVLEYYWIVLGAKCDVKLWEDRSKPEYQNKFIYFQDSDAICYPLEHNWSPRRDKKPPNLDAEDRQLMENLKHLSCSRTSSATLPGVIPKSSSRAPRAATLCQRVLIVATLILYLV